MTTEFDAEAGVLRLAHACIAVLARLAVAPTDPSLTDHATAPPLATLRAAGIIGPMGIHPAIRPLAEVMGAPRAVLDLELETPATPGPLAAVATRERCRGWADAALLVLAVPAPTGGDAWDLMAESVDQAPALLGDVMGLTPAPPAVPAPAFRVEAAELERFEVPLEMRARWRLTVRPVSETREVSALDVVDAGADGLWLVAPVQATDGEHLLLSPTDPAAVRQQVAALLAGALSGPVPPGRG